MNLCLTCDKSSIGFESKSVFKCTTLFSSVYERSILYLKYTDGGLLETPSSSYNSSSSSCTTIDLPRPLHEMGEIGG
jgi:hypothetical protein